MALLQMTVSASVLIITLALVRARWLHRLPKGLLSALWLLPLARLLLPWFPAASFSLAALLGLDGRAVAQGAPPPLGVGGEVLLPVTLSPGGLAPVLPSLGDPAPAVSGLWPLLAAAWAVGAAVLAVRILGRHWALRQAHRDAPLVCHPNLTRWQREHPLRRRVEVRRSSRVQSPLTYEVWRPVILLPAALDLAQQEKLWCILAHEYRHIRRWDALTKWLLAAALCLHWFNPLVWWMHRKASLDMELACDAGVLRTLGREARAPYAALLLELEQEKAAALSLASGLRPTATEERMIAMLRQKKLRPAAGVLILVLLAAVTAMVATRAPGPVPQDPAPVTAPQEESKQEEPSAQEEKSVAQEESAAQGEEPDTQEEESTVQPEETTPATPLNQFTPEEEVLIEQFVTQGEEMSRLPNTRELMYKLATGTPVPAPVAGEVKRTCDWAQWPFGRQVVIRTEDGATMVVGHLSSVLVETGDQVEPGDPIGEAGSSGNICGQGYGICLLNIKIDLTT